MRSITCGCEDPLSVHGRGLRVVQALADHVCWSPRVGGGESVSALFATSTLSA